ncbi:Rgg/GadR/MutR family transcriptional activator [Streptococcus gallinaceus]|uniref:Rgg/GadR/MutR family transcriptional regulator n=1 Tax=Streptococcus gallinaceus TaxID=165758 RepID=UPI00209D9129|nr:Rgg/GadR/MutR family transcriptional regulator [Streptococcus gallinaceus]MCP1639090.1 Rgg/GadR/MutR family transcriptional activator [Streptococcus gallinaceus]MCP1769666.1 Rgg/GadR/MutR family transcriptional activator [Streptococcus gallinaceus]
MPNYGEIFKEFRLNKQLTLTELADDQVSVSQLSRFERGESDLSISKFFHVLEKLKLTPSQFMNRVSNYRRNDQIHLMAQMACAHYQEDTATLAQLKAGQQNLYIEKPQNKRAQLNAILLQGAICDLDASQQMTEQDLGIVSDHLFCTEDWQIDELILIGNLYQYYKTDLMCRLVDEVVGRRDFYMDMPTHKNLVEVTLLNIILTLTERGELVKAQGYDQILEPLLSNERNAYHRLIYLYVKGFLTYKNGNVSGKTDMQHAIQAMVWINNHHHARTYQKHFDKHVGEE